jgi:hypothetical protein
MSALSPCWSRLALFGTNYGYFVYKGNDKIALISATIIEKVLCCESSQFMKQTGGRNKMSNQPENYQRDPKYHIAREC